MSTLLDLPDIVLDNIFSYVTFDETARLRIVCKQFNTICSQRLNKGFGAAEKFHLHILKSVKAQLPRRESERRTHPMARHCDILTAIETRLSMLSMTFIKYIDMNLCCFIPGKVIDEIFRVLRFVKEAKTPPRAHEILQELRDISSMAMEHFDEKIVPLLRKNYYDAPQPVLSLGTGLINTATNPERMAAPHRVAHHLAQMTTHTKENKDAIVNMRTYVKKLHLKMKSHSSKLRSYEKKMQSQESHIHDQETQISDLKAQLFDQKKQLDDIKKHVEELLQQKSTASSSGTGLDETDVMHPTSATEDRKFCLKRPMNDDSIECEFSSSTGLVNTSTNYDKMAAQHRIIHQLAQMTTHTKENKDAIVNMRTYIKKLHLKLKKQSSRIISYEKKILLQKTHIRDQETQISDLKAQLFDQKKELEDLKKHVNKLQKKTPVSSSGATLDESYTIHSTSATKDHKFCLKRAINDDNIECEFSSSKIPHLASIFTQI